MDQSKRHKLQADGWVVGSAEDFLELSPEEAAFIEVKLSLSESLRRRRLQYNMTQVELARRLRSSQSRVAKMEAADPSVSVDLLVRSLLSLGAAPHDIAQAIEGSAADRATLSSRLAQLERPMGEPVPAIRSDPEIMSGTPVFVGTRVPVKNLLDYLAAGDTIEQFLDHFPSVSREQAVAARDHAGAAWSHAASHGERDHGGE